MSLRSVHSLCKRRLSKVNADPDLPVPGQRGDRAESWQDWVEDGADRKELISGMGDISKDILAKCIDARQEEQDSEGLDSEVEDENEDMPTCDTDDEVVEEVRPPPPEGQCSQNAEEANPPGSPGFAACEGEQKGRTHGGRDRGGQ